MGRFFVTDFSLPSQNSKLHKIFLNIRKGAFIFLSSRDRVSKNLFGNRKFAQSAFPPRVSLCQTNKLKGFINGNVKPFFVLALPVGCSADLACDITKLFHKAES